MNAFVSVINSDVCPLCTHGTLSELCQQRKHIRDSCGDDAVLLFVKMLKVRLHGGAASLCVNELHQTISEAIESGCA